MNREVSYNISMAMEKTTTIHPTTSCSELRHNALIPSQFVLPPEHRLPFPQTNAYATTEIEVPVIDITDLQALRSDLEAQGGGWESVAGLLARSGVGGAASAIDRIHEVCREWGTFQLLGHGVSMASLESLLSRFRHFLDLQRGGDAPFRGEDGQGFGTSYVNPDVGTAEWRDYVLLLTQPRHARDYTKWTSFLRDEVEKVSEEMLGLSRFVLALLSWKLGFDVESAIGGALHQKMLLSHYPPCPQPELATGSFQHTDIGVLTCVWQPLKDVNGLQVLHPDGQRWLHVPSLPTAIFINIGDQLEIVTNGLYRSGPHRVVLNDSKSRISIIAFHNPHPTAIISPVPTLLDDKHLPKYESTCFGSYAKNKAIKLI